MCNAALYRVLIALLWAFAYHNAWIGIDYDGSLRNFKDFMSPTMICGGNMKCVVAVVVSLSKAIKLITVSTEMRERIFAVCMCVCVMDNRQINYKPECCGVDIYCRTEQQIVHNHTK